MAILRLALRNDTAEISRINFALREFLDEEGVHPDALNRVRLVIEELVVNVIDHGYDDDAAHRITLDVRTEGRRVIVTVEDDGKPFDPRAAPPPLLKAPLQSRKTRGHGIYIVKHMTSELGYVRENGRNRVRAVIDTTPAKETT